MTFIDFLFHLEPGLAVLLRRAIFNRRFSRSTRSSCRARVSISSSTMASSFRAIALLLARRVRKDFWQPIDTVPWNKFSPDYLVGVIPDDLNCDASLFPCCFDHRPRSPSISRLTVLISSSTSSLVNWPFRTSTRLRAYLPKGWFNQWRWRRNPSIVSLNSISVSTQSLFTWRKCSCVVLNTTSRPNNGPRL